MGQFVSILFNHNRVKWIIQNVLLIMLHVCDMETAHTGVVSSFIEIAQIHFCGLMLRGGCNQSCNVIESKKHPLPLVLVFVTIRVSSDINFAIHMRFAY